MKKYFIILLFLLLFTGCNKSLKSNKDFIFCPLVDITRSINQPLNLTFYVITSVNYESINVEKTYLMENSRISKAKEIIVTDNNEKLKAYLYETNITFVNTPFTIKTLNIRANNQTHEIKIGKVQVISLDECEAITSNTQTNNQKLTIFIHNGLEEDIYLANIIGYKQKLSKTSLVIPTITPASQKIYSDATSYYKEIEVINYNNYYQLEGFLDLTFLTSLKEYHVYPHYYFNYLPSIKKLEKEGIPLDGLLHVNTI